MIVANVYLCFCYALYHYYYKMLSMYCMHYAHQYMKNILFVFLLYYIVTVCIAFTILSEHKLVAETCSGFR